MDIQELAHLTETPVRRLRHCLDAGLVPGLEVQQGKNVVGRRRQFNEDVGFAICCAAKLLEADVGRGAVVALLTALRNLTFADGSKLVLNEFFQRGAAGWASLGDGCNVRLEVEFKGSIDDAPYDTGWIVADSLEKLEKSYRPTTEIRLNIGRIVAQIFRRASVA